MYPRKVNSQTIATKFWVIFFLSLGLDLCPPVNIVSLDRMIIIIPCNFTEHKVTPKAPWGSHE